MLKVILVISFFFFLPQAGSETLLSPQHEGIIFINNRILTKINGKAISVIDVMKKMDMLFYKQFPQYSSFPEARFQFYQHSWKNVLKELVEKELIMADAEENKLEISKGDIRQEMENLFGPNIILNLDRAGLTFDEAQEMVREDLIIKRIISARVNAKAFRSVTPDKIRKAYEKYSMENKQPEKWTYRVLSIRTDEPSKGAELAHYAYSLAVEEGNAIDELAALLKKHPLFDETISFTLSDEYRHAKKEMSESYKAVLTGMQPGSYSPPIQQKSRINNSAVFRIFYLINIDDNAPPPLSKIEKEIRNYLIDKAVSEESEKYFARLYNRHKISKDNLLLNVSDDFEPFTLK